MMLNKTHGAARKLAGLLVSGGFAVAGLTLAAPAAADQPSDQPEVRRIEIKEVRGDKDVVIKRDGREAEIIAKCPGEKVEIGSEGGTEARKENLKFVLCTKPGESLIAALEKAAADFDKRDEVSAERKADMVAKIRAKIAELRAKG